MMHGLDHWSHWVQDCESRGERYIVVTLIGARGSTPRASGTKMVVAESLVRGTIGGGELEHRVIRRAQELLTDEGPAQLLEHYPLGEKLGQCCGGSTSVKMSPNRAFYRSVSHNSTCAKPPPPPPIRRSSSITSQDSTCRTSTFR